MGAGWEKLGILGERNKGGPREVLMGTGWRTRWNRFEETRGRW